VPLLVMVIILNLSYSQHTWPNIMYFSAQMTKFKSLYFNDYC